MYAGASVFAAGWDVCGDPRYSGGGRVAGQCGGRDRAITGRDIRASDANSGADWIEIDVGADKNTALKPHRVFGWHTYNLSVDRYHTYIAGGYRVHNDCWLDGDELIDIVPVPEGIKFIGRNAQGSLVEVTEYFNKDTGAMRAIQRDVIFGGGNGAKVTKTWRDFDA